MHYFYLTHIIIISVADAKRIEYLGFGDSLRNFSFDKLKMPAIKTQNIQ